MADARAFATFAGAPVLRGTLTLPADGVWFARLAVGTDAVPTGLQPLVVGDATWIGTVFSGGAPYGRLDALIVGGAGRLGAQVPGRDFRASPARVPADDTVRAVGETLSGVASASLDRFLPEWLRVAGSAAGALGVLAAALGARWRVLADGTVWVGNDAQGASAARGTRLDEMPDARARVYALETYALYPGERFDGWIVGDVEHRFGAHATRTTVRRA